MFDFIAATGMTLLWDMNGLKTRDGSGPWNPAVNATAMLTYLNSKYGGKVDYAFSVGNEPEFWDVKVCHRFRLLRCPADCVVVRVVVSVVVSTKRL